jgi:CMP-N-acetylneuraminic acid synthetase
MKNNIHAIILARGGSKGIKNKNLISIKNKPLVYWSIKHSKSSKLINETWVSSEDNKILKVSEKYKAKLIIRPKKIATSKSSSESAWIHAINFLKSQNIKATHIVGIQPTSPIRSPKDFDDAIKYFISNKFDSMFTSTVINDHCIWKKNKSKNLIANYNYKNRKPRQLIEDKFLENGSFYIFKTEKFLKHKCRLFGKIGTYKMPKIKSFQIDDMDDVNIIKLLVKKYLK